MSVRNFTVLVALVLLPVFARAEEQEPGHELDPGHWLVGGAVHGGFAPTGQTMLLTGIASYTVVNNITLGIEGGHSVLGLNTWRAGVVGQFFFGPAFLRPFVQVRLEALAVRQELSPALGCGFGLSWHPTDRLAVIGMVGFDGTMRFEGTSLLETGVSVQYVVF